MPTYKTYFHPIPNSCFHVQRAMGTAEALIFHGGKLQVDTEDKQAIEQLDSIADKHGTFVTTHGVSEMTDSIAAAAEVRHIAESTVDKIIRKG